MGETIFSAFRWKGWLDTLSLAPEARLAIAFLLDSEVAHPSITSLLREFPNLQNLAPAGALSIPGKAAWLKNHLLLNENPAIPNLVPAWIRSLIPESELFPFVTSIQTRPPVWLRARRNDVDAVCALLRKSDVHHRRDPRIAGAIALQRVPSSEILHNLARRGCCAQDIASQAVGLLCAVKPGSHWWDMCAGAGGKTLHLSDQLGASGSILASDIRENPLRELERRAQLAGVKNIRIRQLRPDQQPPGSPFDGILIDAPCSGVGTWGRNPDARWRTSLEQVTRMVATQRELLQRAIPHLKPGGVLVFSTCSILPQEGHEVVNNFLQANPSLHPLASTSPLDHTTTPSGCIAIWPADGPGIGMSMAAMTR